ncbi:glycoside hydrolase superfamily [Lasiosphaeris hirsuta]|uniref:Glycoside hydrolase superfamily n=1 Tax=Lasiosphaeris hirsuta TaxID=260670 RepID=A0AA40E1C1_9PEZI|nr:glycoside hydrolase superfamily [Lasiosphaeris hirsuta]
MYLPQKVLAIIQVTGDFQATYDSGARFIIIKATEGMRTVDAKFVDHTIRAVDVGLYHGAYNFARPAASSGDAQANFFLANGGAWVDCQTLPGMFDLEDSPDGTQCYGLPHVGMRMWITEFWWRACTGNYDGFSTVCPLVLARYAAVPGPNSDHYAFGGDSDIFNGEEIDLKDLVTS